MGNDDRANATALAVVTVDEVVKGGTYDFRLAAARG